MLARLLLRHYYLPVIVRRGDPLSMVAWVRVRRPIAQTVHGFEALADRLWLGEP